LNGHAKLNEFSLVQSQKSRVSKSRVHALLGVVKELYAVGTAAGGAEPNPRKALYFSAF